MNNKSSRNRYYAVTAFILLAIFWSVLANFFTDYKYYLFSKQLPWLLMTTALSWALVLAKLRKNEITNSSTQELILYIFLFPAISMSTIMFVKITHYPFNIYVSAFLLGSILISCLTWLLLRLNETIEFNFGRKIKIHSKLTHEQFKKINEALNETRLVNHIDLCHGDNKVSLTDFELLIVSNTSEIDDEIISAHLAGVKIESFDNFLISLHGKISATNMNLSSDFFSLKRLGALIMFYQNIKLLIEPIIASALSLLLLPFLILLGTIIRLTSKGPAIFKQVRTGHNGKTFTLYKFRTMKTDAEKDGPKWWTPEDDRVTSFGKILRATHLDELPQLFNIILGDMGFVGPRPELPAFYESLKTDIPSFYLRTLIRPGVTGWAQIKGGYANSTESSKSKLELDLYYIFNISPLLDLQIVVDTLTGNKNKIAESKRISIYESTIIERPEK